MRVEQLGAVAGATPRERLAHVRIWFGAAPAESAATLLKQVASGGVLTFEFWDFRKPTADRVAAAGLHAESVGGHTVVRNVSEAKLEELLQVLASESFGIWSGIAGPELELAMSRESSGDRAAELPDGAAFAVMSLYDENVELFAKGSAADRSSMVSPARGGGG